ncbi:GrBNV_gp78-like protein [Drosophila innubila nudivirus]|uniref:GrBNV_gp78-like protein n=1 Tax=Drosophila innubila nudivirus TaxID=2057187 RepID=A0A2H4UX46_9VIRU|nr:GrBNV_gp78-like protein [Drosophila innubila nudivirus]ATZ81488.1 GrBNV_gp78-like protein [Drosophila innubila nudivirus]
MSDDDGIILDSSVDDMFTMESCTLDGYDEIGTRENDNNRKYASFNGITEDKCKMDETMITTEITTEVTITTTKTKTPKVTTIPDNYNDANLKKNAQTTNGIVGHNNNNNNNHHYGHKNYLENRNRDDDEGNTQCRMDDDEYDYEDDDDDGINITIASPTIPSLMDVRLNNNTNALTELEISNDVISKPTTTITSTTMDENEENNKLNKVVDQADFNAENIIEDIGIREELNKLVTNSIILPTLKCITVKYNNQIILISSSTPISSRLASIFWVYPKIYVKQQMPFLNEFNKIIANSTYTPEMMTAHDKHGNEIYRSCKYAVFSVKYKKNFVTNARANDTKASDSGNIDSNIIKPDGFKKSNTGIYHYLDFAAVIIENGKIIDYAIHGFVSNIAEMIHIHKPSRVYYNARRGDALDVFMNYQYQPFYESCYGKLTPTIINRTNDFFNPLAFCERQDIYCALCNCLRDVRGLLFKLPEQISIVNNYTKQSTPTEYAPHNHHNDNNNIAEYNSQYTYNEYQYQPYYQLEQYPTDYYYYPQIQQYTPTYPYYESNNVMPIPINSFYTEESSTKTSVPIPAKELTPTPASSPTPSSLSSSSSSTTTTTTVRSVRKSDHSNYNQRYSNAKDRQNYKYTPNKKHEKFIDKQQQQYRRRYNSQTSTRPQYHHHHQQQQKHYHNYNQNHDTHYEQQPQNRSRQMIDRYKYYLDKYRHHQFHYANNPFRRINPIGKNHLMQPDYNTQKRRIQYALKKPGAFNGFRNERRNLDSKYYS